MGQLAFFESQQTAASRTHLRIFLVPIGQPGVLEVVAQCRHNQAEALHRREELVGLEPLEVHEHRLRAVCGVVHAVVRRGVQLHGVRHHGNERLKHGHRDLRGGQQRRVSEEWGTR